MKQEFMDLKITEFSRWYPHKTAIKTDGQDISYLELEEKSNQIANFMNDKIEKTPHVVTILDRSPELIESIIGLLKCGLVFVPLNPLFPGKMIKKMIEEIRAEWVLTSLKYYKKFGEIIKGNGTNRTHLKTLLCDGKGDGPDSHDNIFYLDSKIKRDALAFERVYNKDCYIYFTSGSTGTPKGVLGRHTSLAHFIQWEMKEFGVNEDFHISQFTPPSFDPFLRDIFLPLMAGATSHIPSHDTLMNMRKLIRWIDEHKINLIHTVPSLFKKLVFEINDSNCFHNLRYILLAGELLRGRDIYKFIETFNDRIQLVNVYGPTETTLAKLFYLIKHGDVKRTIIPVGKPIDDAQVLILDSKRQKCRQGRKGDIYIRTPFISSGYYNDPHLTKKLFIKNPYGKHENDIIYKTGDQGRLLRDGNIELTGRTDFQVKIRGARVELGEIENQLLMYNGIQEAVVTGKEDNNGEKYLCAYVTPESGIELDIPSLRDYLSRELPNYMIPAYFVVLEKIPLTPNGKIDRTMLPEPKEFDINPGINYLAPQNSIERRIADIWKEILQLDKVGVNYNFFDIGGDSLKIIAMSRKLNEEFKKDIPIPEIFANPTISFLAKYLKDMEIDKTDLDEIFEKPGEEVENENRFQQKIKKGANKTGKEIAVIGMSCRFPGARNVEEFWKNLKEGKETITFFSYEELLNAGVSHDLLSNPNYVRAVSQIKDKEYFDARFFGYTPREAELLDPQIRLFHECSWEAIEDSGIIPDFYSGAIGVYAGAMQNLEWEMRAALSGKSRAFGLFAASKLTGIRYLCTRLSYNLNLKGPSVTMQTACSTSLVAIHMASRALLEGECDVAIAGGVTVSPEKHGYVYEEDMIYSHDGHCRSFDAKANGTLFGEGVGVVVLKPLEDAITENHHIYAVIKGSAINNDGNRKVGFTAPSVPGQAEAIRAAFQVADVEPGSITYVETHGTATTLGDPIEIEALKQAFNTDKNKICKIGSVKSNFGHLDTAAGVAGFIKAVLSLKNRMIPPSLYFETPNPAIDFDNSPFQVNTRLIQWKRGRYPLRAGINSVGMGGTNAHVILEEAPQREESTKSREWQLILLSAKTETALDRTSGNLADFLKKIRSTNLADMAYTLQVGRRACKYRKMLVCSTANEAIAALSTQDKRKAPIFFSSNRDRPVFFMFSGLGSQYMNMGLDLYLTEPFFCQEMDLCFDILKPILDFDIKGVLYPGQGVAKLSEKDISQDMNRIEIAQVVMFIFEYVLARLLMHWGIEPQAMIGYSFGEYVAACIAGVFSLEDALKLVVFRGKLIQRLSPGAMVSVPLTKEQVKPLLNNHLSLAIDNGESCIITGSKKEIDAFEKKMKKRHCICISLPNSYAIHSPAMEPILEKFRERVKQIPLTEHKIPYISNLTGQWITVEQATNPSYWATHLSQTVRFAEGIKELLKEPNAIFLEIGPGGDLSSMLRRYIDKSSSQIAINPVRQRRNKVSDVYYLLRQIGKLWAHGKRINWYHFYAQEKRHIISLPTYPFERQRYWIDRLSDPMYIKPVKKESNQYQIQMESSEETPSPSLINRFDLSSEYVAPTSDIESRLVGIFQNFLGTDKIGTLDDFFELGIDSLGTISIGIDIFKEFNIKIPIADLFNLPNVKELSEYILHVQNEELELGENVNENLSASSDNEHEVLEVDKNWNTEEISNYLESPGNILLTGASGFLGAHVLKELLDKTKANIYCLLRDDTPNKAFHRGKEIWNFYFGNQLEKYYQSRIFLLKGDIIISHLGMKKNSYDDLTGKMDTVIHCAADVRHFGRYDNFKKTNIEGTQRIIDFCFSGIDKKLHHISTIGILRPSSIGHFHFKESDLDVGHSFDQHLYLKSKFEAEKLVYRARNSGLKASIYRIGNLVGRCTDGLFQKNIGTNVIYNHIKAMIFLKKFPSILNETEIEMAPVDACSRSLVNLVVLKDAIGYNFHLLNSNFLSFKTLVEYINEYGYPIDTVALRTFSDFVHSEVKSERFQKEIEINRIFYLLRNAAENADDINSRQQSSLTIDREFTVEVLKKTGFSWSEIDFALLSKIINHCVAVGYLKS